MGLTDMEVPALAESQTRPVSGLTLQKAPDDEQCATPTTPARHVYYQILRCTSPLPSNCAVDPHDSAIGQAPAIQVPTVPTIKRYIAQREGFYSSQLEVISLDDETDRLPPDGAYITLLEEEPHIYMHSPLALSLCEPSGDTLSSSARWGTPPVLPISIPSPFLHVGASSSVLPSPRVETSLDVQVHNPTPLTPTSSHHSSQPVKPLDAPVQLPPPDPRWTIGKDGFSEPIESLTEAFKVVSQDKPPGWLGGRVRCIGPGMFMGKLGKKKHANVTLSGTVWRNGMRLWVDARRLKDLTLRTGDTFHTYRVIAEETREMTYLWVGDISLDCLQI